MGVRQTGGDLGRERRIGQVTSRPSGPTYPADRVRVRLARRARGRSYVHDYSLVPRDRSGGRRHHLTAVVEAIGPTARG